MVSDKRTRTSSVVKQQARQLRKEMTTAEARLWERLRGRRLAGLKFRRQHPVGPFIADFYCAEQRLIIELDGAIHAAQIEQDQARTRQFEAHGYRVMRFRNERIEQEIEKVLSEIAVACQDSAPLPELGEGCAIEDRTG